MWRLFNKYFLSLCEMCVPIQVALKCNDVVGSSLCYCVMGFFHSRPLMFLHTYLIWITFDVEVLLT